MKSGCNIKNIIGREVLDSRGNPTVEVDVILEDGSMGRAMVPSGASTGKFEAVELRDKEKRFHGKGVQTAVNHVNHRLADRLLGKCAKKQMLVDTIMIEADGTNNKEKFGANAILGVSLATAKAAADFLGIPLFQYLGGCFTKGMPMPMMNILNGGKHADNLVDFQEFMIVPVGAESLKDAMVMGTEIYHTLKKILKKDGMNTAVGDEGGFAPDLGSTIEALDLLVEAIESAGYKPEEEVMIAMDCAASELYNEDEDVYYFPGESEMKGKEIKRNSEEMVQYFETLVENFPIMSIEDGLNEEDYDGWKVLTYRLGDKILLVGDDLFVTNKNRLEQGIKQGIGNSILVKLNQVGTLTETLETIETAKKAGYDIIISHRSGETEDPVIADLAVAVSSQYIKAGAPCRSDRTSKYNQLIRIEELLSDVKSYHEIL
ncbi:MAG: phosphopyruvate hydratase [Anaerostipes sp.]|nr:phosphopyruvate hydratase [Anaerostipes sp.]